MALNEEDLHYVVDLEVDDEELRRQMRDAGLQVDRISHALSGDATKAAGALAAVMEQMAAHGHELAGGLGAAAGGGLQPRIELDPLREMARIEGDIKRTAEEIARLSSMGGAAALAGRLQAERELADLQRRRLTIANQLDDPARLREIARLENEVAEAEHRRAMAAARIQADPGLARDRVRRDLESERAKSHLAGTEAAERSKQRGIDWGSITRDVTRGTALAPIAAAATGGQPEAAGSTLGSIGGTVGTALGGPIGAAVGQVIGDGLTKTLQGITAGPFQAVAGGLNMVNGALRELSGALGPIGIGFDLAGGAVRKMKDVFLHDPISKEILGPMFDAIGAIPDALKGMTEALVGMARVANPAAFKRWEMSLQDVQGVIGQSFLPVLGMMTDAVRGVGDVFATVLPNFDEVQTALSGFRESFNEVGRSIREVAGEVGPVIRTGLIVGLRLVGDAAAWVGRQVAPLISRLAELVRPLRELLGIEGGMRSSVGAAAQAAHLGDVAEYQRSLQVSSFSQGAPTMANLPSTVGAIERIMNNIYAFLSKFTLLNIAGAVGVAVVAAWRRIMQGAGDVLAAAGDMAKAGGAAVADWFNEAWAGMGF